MEDFIITVIALALLGGALYLNVVLQDTKAMDIMKKIFWPLIKLKEWVDPNHWANKLGEKSGAYDKARNSKIRKWGDSLEGWRWWTWQIVGGGITPDRYAKPFHSLNFNIYRDFGVSRNSRVTLGFRNLLNSDREFVYKGYDDEKIFTSVNPGVSVQVKYSYNF